MTTPITIRLKPRRFSAMKYTGENDAELNQFCGARKDCGVMWIYDALDESSIAVHVGDWVVIDPRGYREFVVSGSDMDELYEVDIQ